MIVPQIRIPAAKPLYLPHGREWRVSLDGTALRIDTSRSATRFTALRRIARVVSASDTVWQTRALLACLKAGIPIVFVDRHGQVQGYCHGRYRRETALANLLTEAVELPNWQQRYGDWFHAMHNRQIRLAFSHVGVRMSFSSRAAARSKLCTAWQQRTGYLVAPLLRRVDGLMYALVVECLKNAVGSARFLGHSREGFCLANDLTELLCWSSYQLLDGVKKGVVAEPLQQRVAAELVENNRNVLAKQLSSLVDALEIWLREWMWEQVD